MAVNTHSVNADPFAGSEMVSPATQKAPLEAPAVYDWLLTDVAKKAHTSDPEWQGPVGLHANAVVTGGSQHERVHAGKYVADGPYYR